MQSTLLGELLEQAEIAAVGIDSGRIVAANEYACELMGFDRTELIGRSVVELGYNLSEQDPTGVIGLRCKDDSETDVGYRAVRSAIAGLTVTLCLLWPV